MSKNITSGTFGFLFDNHLLSSVIALALLAAGIAAESVVLLLASGVAAYGWPFFYVYLLERKTTPESVGKAPVKRPNVARPHVASAH